MQQVKLIFALVLLFSTQLQSQTSAQKKFQLKSSALILPQHKAEILNEKFSHYTTFTLDENVLEEISKTKASIELSVNIAGISEQLELLEKDLFSSKYYGFDHEKNEPTETPENIFYEGYSKSTNELVRLAISNNFFMGLIKTQGKVYYIEPTSRLLGESDTQVYIIYEPSAVLKSGSHQCGYEDVKSQIGLANTNSVVPRLDNSTGGTECRLLEIAQAYDQGMRNRYGSNSNLSIWNAAIWNVVDGLYANEFSVDIDFVIVAEAFAPNFNTSSNISTYLSNFRSWGNSGGFGVTFDIGNLWTTLNLQSGGNSSVIGSVMDIPGVCGTNRYQIFEDFVGPTSVPPSGSSLANLAVLIAHEVGHNLGMYHNDGPGANIMEPSLNANATSFSQVSKHYFESILLEAPCYSSCECIEISNATPINCSADGMTHDLELIIEHDNTGSFTVNAGGTSSSFTYSNSPQTISLLGVGSSVNAITASDDSDAACNFTSNIDLPDDSNIASIATTHCSTDNVNIALDAITQENYGSIIITVNGDDYANSEQTIQILDKMGNVVVDYPFGSFADNNTTVVNSGPLLLDPLFTPYKVVVGDWFGDGMGSNQCQNTNGGPGSYGITDGQGNVIRANAGLQNSNVEGCSGNDAIAEITTANLAVDYTSSGNWSGPGVTNGPLDDGQATFNPSTAGLGVHNLDYTFNSYKGCVAVSTAVTVSTCGNVCPMISTVVADVDTDQCSAGTGISVNYSANISSGTNGVDYEVIWTVNGSVQSATTDIYSRLIDPINGCTPIQSPTVTAQIRCLSDNSTPDPAVANSSASFIVFPEPIQDIDYSVVNDGCSVSITDLCGSLVISNDKGTGSSFAINQGDPDQNVNFIIRSPASPPASCEQSFTELVSCPCPTSPTISSVGSNLSSDACINKLAFGITYRANVNGGTNGVDYEIVWRIDQTLQMGSGDKFVYNIPTNDGCTILSTPNISAQIFSLCQSNEIGTPVFNTDSFDLYPTPIAGVDYEIVTDDCTVSINDLCGSLIIDNDLSGGNSHTIPQQSSDTDINFSISVAAGLPRACTIEENLTIVCPPCPDSLDLSGSENGTIDYEVSDFIESDQVLLGGSIDYDAGNYIIMQPGFQVTQGVLFNAFIDGCDMGGGGVNLESGDGDMDSDK